LSQTNGKGFLTTNLQLFGAVGNVPFSF